MLCRSLARFKVFYLLGARHNRDHNNGQLHVDGLRSLLCLFAAWCTVVLCRAEHRDLRIGGSINNAHATLFLVY